MGRTKGSALFPLLTAPQAGERLQQHFFTMACRATTTVSRSFPGWPGHAVCGSGFSRDRAASAAPGSGLKPLPQRRSTFTAPFVGGKDG